MKCRHLGCMYRFQVLESMNCACRRRHWQQFNMWLTQDPSLIIIHISKHTNACKRLPLYLPEKSIYSNYQNQLYLTVWSSLPVAKMGFFGWTAKAHNSPSAWPWTTHRGLSRLFTWTSKISLSWVPINSWSPRQHTLRRHNPEGGKIRSEAIRCLWPISSWENTCTRKGKNAPPRQIHNILVCFAWYSIRSQSLTPIYLCGVKM